MISPTGHSVRGLDNHGEGKYGAGRGTHLHAGADYICIPGQDVVSPITGTVIRIARPYKKKGYSGLLIRGLDIEIKMFYIDPLSEVVGTKVRIGDLIGTAQDISKKYRGMVPHIHLSVVSVNPELFITFP